MTHESLTTVTACPRCLSQLAVPGSASAEVRLECPVCRVEFALAAAAVRELPLARVIASPAPAPASAPLLLDAPVDVVRPASAAPTGPLAHEATVSAKDDAAMTDSFANLIAKIEQSEQTPAVPSRVPASQGSGPAFPTVDERSHGIFAVRSAAPQRRRRSIVRLLAGVIVFGALGLALGAYVLLWLKGAEGDVFRAARYLPDWLLPPSMQVAAQDEGLRSDDAPAQQDQREDKAADAVDEPLADGGVMLAIDDGVKPTASSEGDGSDPDAAVVPALAAEGLAGATSPGRVWPVTALLAGVRDVHWFPLEELSRRLTAAEPAAAKFAGGDLGQPELIREMGQAYVDLCALAEAYTLSAPVLSDSELFAKQVLAKAALRWTAAPARQSDLAVIAMRWLAHRHRANQGVLFVGTVRENVSQGPWTEHMVEIVQGDEHERVPVLTDGAKLSAGDVVGIAGAIIDRPRERIAEYQGEGPLAVIAGYAFDPGTGDETRSAALEALPQEQ